MSLSKDSTSRTKILQCHGNIKESWKKINQLLNKRSKSTNIERLSDTGTEITSKSEIANVMNEYFCSVGKILQAKLRNRLTSCYQGTMRLILKKEALLSRQFRY